MGSRVFGHALQVKFDRFPDVVRDFLDGLSGGDALWQIGDKSGHVVGPAFDHHRVLLPESIRCRAQRAKRQSPNPCSALAHRNRNPGTQLGIIACQRGLNHFRHTIRAQVLPAQQNHRGVWGLTSG
jgi:hypothetical protein